MHLSNSQLLQLITPFALASVLYIYSDDVVQYADNIFPTIKQYKNTKLDKKAAIYLKIQRDNNIYMSILNQKDIRNKQSEWIVQKLLYTKQKNQSTTPHPSFQRTRVHKRHKWHLEVLYPKKKIAIINAQLVHEGSKIDGAQVLQITAEKILLKTTEGLQWVSLFQ